MYSFVSYLVVEKTPTFNLIVYLFGGIRYCNGRQVFNSQLHNYAKYIALEGVVSKTYGSFSDI